MPIRKRCGKNGKVTYTPFINYQVDGVNQKKYGSCCSSEKEAKLQLKELEFKLECEKRELCISPITKKISKKKSTSEETMTWDDLYTIYIDYKRSQGIGIAQFETVTSRYRIYIQPVFGSKRIIDTTKSEALEFRTHLMTLDMSDYVYNKHGHLSARTINKIINIPKEMLRVAKEVLDLEFKNPFVFKRLKIEEFKSTYYSEDEFYKYLSVIDNPMDKVLFSLLFYTGLRIGEATALTYNDVLNKNGTILIDKTRKYAQKYDGRNSIGKPKTEASVRNIYIDKDLEQMILDYRELTKSKYPNFDDSWFIFGTSKPIGFSTLRRHNEIYANKAKLPVIRLHDFRGSFTTNLFTYTTNIKVVSKLLGHSDVETTTKYYLKIKDDDKKELISKVSGNRKIRLEL